jgi:lipid-binding SYLF domain-containing protein
MRPRMIAQFLAVVLVSAVALSAKDTPDQKREKSRKMAAQTLEDLYKLQPAAQAAIQKSAGYAVFSNVGVNLLLLSTAHGAGIAIDSKTKQETFMKMISAGAGLGMGAKDYRVIFVFEDEKALGQFLNSGWAAGAQTDAAAKTSTSGGAYSGAIQAAPGVWVYQITKKGLALQLTLQGTKYSKDDELNKKS